MPKTIDDQLADIEAQKKKLDEKAKELAAKKREERKALASDLATAIGKALMTKASSDQNGSRKAIRALVAMLNKRDQAKAAEYFDWLKDDADKA